MSVFKPDPKRLLRKYDFLKIVIISTYASICAVSCSKKANELPENIEKERRLTSSQKNDLKSLDLLNRNTTSELKTLLGKRMSLTDGENNPTEIHVQKVVEHLDSTQTTTQSAIDSGEYSPVITNLLCSQSTLTSEGMKIFTIALSKSEASSEEKSLIPDLQSVSKSLADASRIPICQKAQSEVAEREKSQEAIITQTLAESRNNNTLNLAGDEVQETMPQIEISDEAKTTFVDPTLIKPIRSAISIIIERLEANSELSRLSLLDDLRLALTLLSGENVLPSSLASACMKFSELRIPLASMLNMDILTDHAEIILTSDVCK